MTERKPNFLNPDPRSILQNKTTSSVETTGIIFDKEYGEQKGGLAYPVENALRGERKSQAILIELKDMAKRVVKILCR